MLRAIDLKRDKEVIRNLLSLGGLEKELLSSTPKRRKMPIDRPSITHKFDIAEHEGYLTTGLYEDGSPGEMFITMAKEGSTIGGVMDAFGTAISLCLQYGVPSPELSRKFAHSRFEPAGFTKNPELPNAKSIVDYIFRWMDITFPNGKMADWTPEVYRVLCRTAAKEKALNKITALAEQSMTAREEPEEELPPTSKRCKAVAVKAERTSSLNAAQSISEQAKGFQEDAPACDVCGSITERNGACYKCRNCGNSMGCS
jgi:ribonucleoside-diphosphate reductase alpha chain